MNTMDVLSPANMIWHVLSITTQRSGTPALAGSVVADIRSRSSALPGSHVGAADGQSRTPIARHTAVVLSAARTRRRRQVRASRVRRTAALIARCWAATAAIEHVAGVLGCGISPVMSSIWLPTQMSRKITGLDVIGIGEVVLGLEVPVRHRRVGHRIGDQAERVAGLDLDHTVRIVDVRAGARTGSAGRAAPEPLPYAVPPPASTPAAATATVTR